MDKLIELTKNLHTDYFLPGHYVIKLPSNFNHELKFNTIYHPYFQGYIYQSIVELTILDIPLKVVIHKPYEPVHTSEFEDYFGFGRHCRGYDPTVQKIYCPKYPKTPIDELLSKINTRFSSGTIAEDTIKDVCLLMILGGYWNEDHAISDLLTFSQSEFGIRDIGIYEIYNYLFDKLKEKVKQD
jgi:hypothetical protein